MKNDEFIFSSVLDLLMQVSKTEEINQSIMLVSNEN